MNYFLCWCVELIYMMTYILQEQDTGKRPMLSQLYLATHKKKKDNQWVDGKSKKTFVSLQNLCIKLDIMSIYLFTNYIYFC